MDSLVIWIWDRLRPVVEGTVNGKQVRLHQDKKEAEKGFHEWMIAKAEEKPIVESHETSRTATSLHYLLGYLSTGKPMAINFERSVARVLPRIFAACVKLLPVCFRT